MKKIYLLLVLVLVIGGCGKKEIIVPTPPVVITPPVVTPPVITPPQTSGIEIVPVDPRLRSNNKGIITVPVVIINYIPTTDGIYLDRWRTLGATIPWDDAHKITISRSKQKILLDKIIEKNSIEEGTRFRDYSTNKIKQYVDIDVVAYINVYDVNLIKVRTELKDTTDDNVDNKVTMDWFNIDFNDLINNKLKNNGFDLKSYVENGGVKEVWFTSFPKELGFNSFNVPESNMSSPLGDVSNSDRNNNDLPIYNKTYVVYGDNGWRGVDTDLHNRGHQLESQMTFIDNSTWNNQFAKVGRGGNTHWCPNSTSGYDYWNKTFAKSDIETWKPSGGTFVDVNVDTWLSKTYQFENTISMSSPGPFATGNIDYSKDAQVKWFIYWWQSVPGHQNGIDDNGKIVTNWWDIFYNWDGNIQKGTKLIN